MASTASQSQDIVTYSAPKRIKVTSCGDGIEVKLETEKTSPQESNKEETSSPAAIVSASVEEDIPKDGYFETEIESKSSSFVITEEEWDSMKPRNMPSGGRLLTGPWAHILSEHLRKSNPYCSFAFHYNRLKTENSRKRLAPFFKGIGICKIKECGVTVRLLIRGVNEKKRLVDVSYSGTLKHRVPAPWKGYVRPEKRRGMLLLGLGIEPDEVSSRSQENSSNDRQKKD